MTCKYCSYVPGRKYPVEINKCFRCLASFPVANRTGEYRGRGYFKIGLSHRFALSSSVYCNSCGAELHTLLLPCGGENEEERSQENPESNDLVRELFGQKVRIG